jgi:type I restriction enzyme M protein
VAPAAGPPVTTAQRLARIVKSARDIMRKDKGLNGDLDRLPMLTWIMFLKFLDDMERVRETEAELAGRTFVPSIEAPYRWRDWASPDDGITGDALIGFVNNERATLPTGDEGLGLFAHLRQLQGANGGDRRDVIATVFRGAVNRMINGYLLRDVVNKVDEIHFESTDEIHTLGTLYESMLREMRDAAGDSGEFYTPRPVVQFMVRTTDPQIGDLVLDPACGTGGFLVEAYLHMLRRARTVEDRDVLTAGIIGGEAKPLPYLLAQMNLLLHGIETPKIATGNSLATRINEIGERDRVDVVLTNPPFGGEEEAGIRDNFPPDRRTSETALLFLQLIMRRLRRTPRPGSAPSRAAVVVPNGTLFGTGVATRIKQELLTEFDLHTVIRLPGGVFAPYTSIATNLLFFDRSGDPTETVWYYEVQPPDGRRQYTKTTPVRLEDFDACAAWWTARVEGPQAWAVPAAELLADDCNLDRQNPHRSLGRSSETPEALLADILGHQREVVRLVGQVEAALRELRA